MTRFLIVFFFIFFILPLLARLALSLAAFFMLRSARAQKNSASREDGPDVIDVSGKIVS